MVPQDPFAQQPAPPVPGRNHGGGDERFNRTQTSPMLAEGPAQSQEPYPANGYPPPQYYYPQSSVLTPARSPHDDRPAPNYPGQEAHHPEARPAAAQPAPAPILVPPGYSHAEPAPAPVYHAPPAESHPAPPPAPAAESHSSPPPSSSSSSVLDYGS